MSTTTTERFHALDAVRGFALLLGVVFHAGMSFVPGLPPGIWAINDTSPSQAIGTFVFTSHIFRMSLFFFIAGFFAHMVFHRRGARGFWTDRAKRILVPLIAGWIVLAPLLGAIWVWGLTKTFGGTLPAPPADAPPPPAGAFPLTHLWFLYYLLLLYVIVAGVRSLVALVDRQGGIRRAADATVRAMVRTGAAAFILPLPLVAALYAEPTWLLALGVPTPDQTLIPQVIALAGYGTALAFGWLVHRQTDLLGVWMRQWPVHLAVAIAATVMSLSIVGAGLVPATGWTKVGHAAVYGVAIWGWSFALVGLAMRFMAQPSASVRYVADASYWIYLVHLPIVVALQVLVGHWAWHWSVKFPLILFVSFAVLFASYRHLVRPTFIGQVLNGRRHPRRREAGDTNAGSRGDGGHLASHVGAGEQASTSPVALLSGVRKRHGTIVALDGVDLEVRQGELLALLGPNGAGKSTAIGLWLGVYEPDEGSAALFGRSPADVEVRRHMGVMMQDVALTPELRVRELVSLAASYYADPPPVDETLALLRLEALADRPYARLSGGQKRQVQFAVAICGRPPLVFLDEPTVGLDVEARETMWRVVRDLVAGGCAIVLTTHYLEEAEALADRVAVLAAGRLIASGTVADVRSLVARKQITCTSALDVEDVRAWTGVIAAARDGDRLQITVVDAEDVVRRLLAADAGVRHLEIRQAGLAEAFSELTKEAA